MNWREQITAYKKERQERKYSRTIKMNYVVYCIRLTERDKIKKRKMVYIENDMRAYIGITRNPFKRFEDHKKKFEGLTFIMETIHKDYMTMIDAEELETKYINDYIKNGYKLFNKDKTPVEYRCEIKK